MSLWRGALVVVLVAVHGWPGAAAAPANATQVRMYSAPWERKHGHGEAWLRAFRLRTGKEFVQSSPTTSSDIYPAPVSQSHQDSFPVSASALSFDFHSSDTDTQQFMARAFSRYSTLLFPWSDSGEGAACGVTPMALRVAVSVREDGVELDSHTDESYSITTPPSQASNTVTVAIAAQSVFGAVRALETLSQLVTFDVETRCYAVANNSVVDAPRFAFRGVMVDLSRNFITLNNLYNLVDLMSASKLNALHLHLTDDQAWTIEIPSFPNLAGWGALSNHSHRYSLDEMAAFVGFAKDRGVRVIPEVDMPGHSGKICHAYPEYCAHWIDPSSNKTLVQLLDPTNDATWDFLSSVYDDLGSVFVDDEIHIGGDEVWTVPWSDSPDIQKWMQEHNSSCPDNPSLTCGTIDGLHHYFTRRVIALLRSKGKRMLGWAPGFDGFPVGDHGSPVYTQYPDVTFDNWDGFDPPGDDYWQRGMAAFTSLNASVILSGPFYVTDRWPHPNSGNRFSWHDMYHTDPSNFTGSAQQKRLVRGAKVCVWDDAARTDSGNLTPKIGLLLTAFAEAMWSPNGTVVPSDAPSDYYTQIHIKDHRCRLVPRGITFEPVELIAVPCPEEYSPPPTSSSSLVAENVRLRKELEALRRWQQQHA